MNDPFHGGPTSTGFGIAELDYELPGELIAQQPLPRRDASRLLVLDRSSGGLGDHAINDLPGLLRAGDLLVLNDTNVLPAKFSARRATGGVIRGLFERELVIGEWVIMLEGSRRLRAGESLIASAIDSHEHPVTLRLAESLGSGRWRVTVDPPGSAQDVLARIGRTPLPPYIRRDDDEHDTDPEDRDRYQTVFARRPGAIAAPTAGLHLTHELLGQLGDADVATATVTLHVGIGTFLPIRVSDLSEHRMHAEWFEVSDGAAEAVQACRGRGGRVVAVGTTSVRVLESAAAEDGDARCVRAEAGWTELFLYPPRRPRVVDALLTNFHLPRSTLLALVMSIAGVEGVRSAYRHAIDKRYRFYSYGDAMLIL